MGQSASKLGENASPRGLDEGLDDCGRLPEVALNDGGWETVGAHLREQERSPGRRVLA